MTTTCAFRADRHRDARALQHIRVTLSWCNEARIVAHPSALNSTAPRYSTCSGRPLFHVNQDVRARQYWVTDQERWRLLRAPSLPSWGQPRRHTAGQCRIGRLRRHGGLVCGTGMCALQSHPLSAGHFRVADNRRTSTPPRRQERPTRLCTPGGRSPPGPKQSDGFVGSGGLPHRLGALHRVTTRGTPQSVASFPQVRPRASEAASDRDHEPRSDELRARPDRSRTREGI